MASINDEHDAVDAWKQKYYASLEETENKERQWAISEEQLRAALNKISFVVDDSDGQVEKLLVLLRGAIRSGHAGPRIMEIVNDVSEKHERAQKKKQTQAPMTAQVLVDDLLTALVLPKGMERRRKALRKEVSHFQTQGQESQIVERINALLKDASAVEQAIDTRSPPETQERKGIFKRIFGSDAKDGAATDSSRYTANESSAERGHQTASQTQVVTSVQALMTQFTQELQLPESRKTVIEAHRRSFPATVDHAQLTAWISELAILLNRALEHELGNEEETRADHPELSLSTQEVLLQLLERLEFPEEASEVLDKLRHELEQETVQGPWDPIIIKIADLILGIKQKVQEEKKDTEQFLQLLTQRLTEVDDYLQGAESDRMDSLVSGQELDEVVKAQVKSIESSVQSVHEIDQLKHIISKRLEEIGEHLESFRVNELSRNELAEKRIQTLNERLQMMEQETTELRRRIRKEREQALRDGLTGIYNRLAYDERVDEEYSRWKRFREPVSLVLLDIDYFKKINDSYGHLAGDKALKTIANVIKRKIRETDFFARYGGEEFVIIMPGANADDAHSVADKLRNEVKHCGFHYRDERVEISFSAGIAAFQKEETVVQTLERADQALYKAKQAGRDQCLQAD